MQTEIKVIHNPDRNRFEITLEGHLAVLDYTLAKNTITFVHTGVPKTLGGRGIGTHLVQTGLKYAVEKKLRVIPLCSFVASFMERHPEFQTLLK